MPGTLQPLDQKFAIVDEQGYPTLYFIQWAQQKQIDIGDSITLDQAQELIDTFAASRQIIAGRALDGGGFLSADVTIDHAESLVVPGTYGDATHVPQFVVDQEGHVQGVVLVPISAGGGGALVLLEQHTAAASASLDFTTSISATYDEYLIELNGLIPSTNTVQLLMRMSTNGGASYDAGGNYSWSAAGTNRFGQANSGADSGATGIPCHYSTTGNGATAGYNGNCRLFHPGSTTLHKAVSGTALQLPDNVTVQNDQFGGFYRSLTPVNAFQFLFSAGNIASGTIRVYGVAK